MRLLLGLAGAYGLAFLIAVAQGMWERWKQTRQSYFEAVRLAAVECGKYGWSPVRVTWHGRLRTEMRMDVRHRDGREWTLREAP